MPAHRTKGSWAPRLAGVAVVIVAAGGVLGAYLATSHARHQVVHLHRHQHGPTIRVVSVQTIGIIDFGPDDNGAPWQSNPHDHPLMLKERGISVDFVPIPAKEVSSGTPDWTANRMSDGSEIFLYVPTGQCLTVSSSATLLLAHCDLGTTQRWRELHSAAVRGQAIAQYSSLRNGRCLTAPPRPGRAALSHCGKARTRSQEIAFWWSG